MNKPIDWYNKEGRVVVTVAMLELRIVVKYLRRRGLKMDSLAHIACRDCEMWWGRF